MNYRRKCQAAFRSDGEGNNLRGQDGQGFCYVYLNGTAWRTIQSPVPDVQFTLRLPQRPQRVAQSASGRQGYKWPFLELAERYTLRLSNVADQAPTKSIEADLYVISEPKQSGSVHELPTLRRVPGLYRAIERKLKGTSFWNALKIGSFPVFGGRRKLAFGVLHGSRK